MVKLDLKIDDNMIFSEDLSVIEGISPDKEIKFTPEVFETIVPVKKSKTLNVLNIIFGIIVFFQLNYIIGEYVGRHNAKIERERIIREREQTLKMAALKTQSENFSRDAKFTIEKIQKTIDEINKLQKNEEYIPDSFNRSKEMYDSSIFYKKKENYEKSSKLAIASINAGNIALTYSEDKLNDLKTGLNKKAIEEQERLEAVRKKREEAKKYITKAKKSLKSAAKKTPDKFPKVNVVFEEAKDTLLKAVKLYNQSTESNLMAQVKESISLAKKSDNLSAKAYNMAIDAREELLEQQKEQEALRKAREAIERIKKSKTK